VVNFILEFLLFILGSPVVSNPIHPSRGDVGWKFWNWENCCLENSIEVVGGA